MCAEPRIVVLGVGNILLSDEGIGVYAVEILERDYALPPQVEVIDGGTSGMDCLDRLAEVDLLLIADCMRSPDTTPATITRLDGPQLDQWFKTKISPHQVGLSDVLATLNFHAIAPKKIVLIGVQPQSMATAMALTPPLQAVLPDVVQALVQELQDFGLMITAKEPSLCV